MSIWDQASEAWDQFDTPGQTNDDGTPGAPASEDEIRATLALGLEVFSEVFGVVVSVAGGVATLADGTKVPVAELGTTSVGGEPLPPAPWIAGVPNAATIGIGAILLIVLIKYA